MGSLVTETPYSEITATLEALDRFGVRREHLANLRRNEDLAEQVAAVFTAGAEQTSGNIFQIACEGSYSASKLVERGGYDWFNDWITNERFPLETHSLITRQIELVEFDHSLTSEKVLAEFQRRGLKRPTAEDALYFGSQHKDEQRKGPIVFLHEPVLGPDGGRSVLVRVLGPDGGRSVLVLDGGAGDRSLGLGWFSLWWPRGCRFAGVRESR